MPSRLTQSTVYIRRPELSGQPVTTSHFTGPGRFVINLPLVQVPLTDVHRLDLAIAPPHSTIDQSPSTLGTAIRRHIRADGWRLCILKRVTLTWKSLRQSKQLPGFDPA
jgi:hypothetical protein